MQTVTIAFLHDFTQSSYISHYHIRNRSLRVCSITSDLRILCKLIPPWTISFSISSQILPLLDRTSLKEFRKPSGTLSKLLPQSSSVLSFFSWDSELWLQGESLCRLPCSTASSIDLSDFRTLFFLDGVSWFMLIHLCLESFRLPLNNRLFWFAELLWLLDLSLLTFVCGNAVSFSISSLSPEQVPNIDVSQFCSSRRESSSGSIF